MKNIFKDMMDRLRNINDKPESFDENSEIEYMNNFDIAKIINVLPFGIIIINIILLLIFQIKSNIIGMFVNVCSIYIILIVILPLQEFIQKKKYINKLNSLFLIVKFIIAFVFIVTSYLIFMTNLYALTVTYLLFIATIIVLILILLLESFIFEYHSTKHIKLSYLLKFILMNIAFIFFLIRAFTHVFPPVQKWDTSKIETPYSITIYKMGMASTGKKYNDMNKIYEIYKEDDIKQIMMDIKKQSPKNLTSFNLLNYEKMNQKDTPVYNLCFNYKNEVNKKYYESHVLIVHMKQLRNNENLKEKVYQYLAVKRLLYNVEGIFGFNSYNRVYPFYFSKQTKRVILKYIEDK